LLLSLTGGRFSTTMMIRTCVLETVGARTGERRSNAVVYFNDADDVIVIASKAGAPHHPAWFHNLLANPDDVTFAGAPVRPTVVDDAAERSRLWALADNVLPTFATYRREAAAAGRTIPIVRLSSR
jgi:deazaflavin-dependent oxidoreductase (nitroreductase family)